MSDAIFRRDGERYVPSDHARGPWDPGAMHGGAPGALAGSALQALAPDMQLTRLAFDFLGPVALAPVELEARITKPGRRFQLAEAVLSAAGRPALVAHATLLRKGELEVSEVGRWTAAVPTGGPETGESAPAPGRVPGEGFHLTGMEIRYTKGSILERGPAIGWFRLAHALVEGEETLPIARALAAADFGNGASRVFSFRTHLFVNTDLTVQLLRDPVGEWILLDATTRVSEQGIGMASSVLYDETGPLGMAHQSLYVAPN